MAETITVTAITHFSEYYSEKRNPFSHYLDRMILTAEAIMAKVLLSYRCWLGQLADNKLRCVCPRNTCIDRYAHAFILIMWRMAR